MVDIKKARVNKNRVTVTYESIVDNYGKYIEEIVDNNISIESSNGSGFTFIGLDDIIDRLFSNPNFDSSYGEQNSALIHRSIFNYIKHIYEKSGYKVVFNNEFIVIIWDFN